MFSVKKIVIVKKFRKKIEKYFPAYSVLHIVIRAAFTKTLTWVTLMVIF